MDDAQTYIGTWNDNEEEVISKIKSMLNDYTSINANALIVIVSALCNVSINEIKYGNKHKHCHARWLLFYAYKYLEKTSFHTVAETFSKLGFNAEYCSVRKSIIQMDELIKSEKYWRDKCMFIQSIINHKKAKDNNNNDDLVIRQNEKDIIVFIPKELKNKVKIKEL